MQKLPDYTTYTLTDLYSVLDHLNREKYPEVAAVVTAEIERREKLEYMGPNAKGGRRSGPALSECLSLLWRAGGALRRNGVMPRQVETMSLITGCAVLFIDLLGGLNSTANLGSMLGARGVMWLAGLYIGILLIRRSGRGIVLGLFFELVQIPIFYPGGEEARLTAGFSFDMHLGTLEGGWVFGIDALAVVMAVVLVRLLFRAGRAVKAKETEIAAPDAP